MSERFDTERQFRGYAADAVIADLTGRIPFLSFSTATRGGTISGSSLFPLVTVQATIDAGAYEDLMGVPPASAGKVNAFVPLLFDGGMTRLPVEFFEALAGIDCDTLHIAFVGLGGGVHYAEVTL